MITHCPITLNRKSLNKQDFFLEFYICKKYGGNSSLKSYTHREQVLKLVHTQQQPLKLLHSMHTVQLIVGSADQPPSQTKH